MRIQILLGIIFTISNICAQDNASAQGSKVKNNSYDRLLNTLLKHSVPEINATELVTRMDEFILLDTRELREYEISHLRGARWVGYYNFKIQKIIDLNKDCPIVCYCSVGYRSEKICEQLKANGFNDVSNLYGSIFEWANLGYPLYDSGGKLTNYIHGFSKLWGRYMNNKSYVKVYK